MEESTLWIYGKHTLYVPQQYPCKKFNDNDNKDDNDLLLLPT